MVPPLQCLMWPVVAGVAAGEATLLVGTACLLSEDRLIALLLQCLPWSLASRAAEGDWMLLAWTWLDTLQEANRSAATAVSDMISVSQAWEGEAADSQHGFTRSRVFDPCRPDRTYGDAHLTKASLGDSARLLLLSPSHLRNHRLIGPSTVEVMASTRSTSDRRSSWKVASCTRPSAASREPSPAWPNCRPGNAHMRREVRKKGETNLSVSLSPRRFPQPHSLAADAFAVDALPETFARALSRSLAAN